MQTMSATQPDTFTNVLLSIKTRQLENILWNRLTGTQASSTKASFEFSESAKESLIASSMRCFVQRNVIQA